MNIATGVGKCQEGPLEILSALHTDGAVVFHGEKLAVLGAIPANVLGQTWGTIADRSTTDMYFSINSANGSTIKKASNLPTGYFCQRTRDNISLLNALFVDIDLHEGGDVQELKTRIDAAKESSGLPEPTYTVFSGRGWWLLWQFTEPLPAKGSTGLWRRAAESVYRAFASVGADRTATMDITRVMRVPGSINPKTGTPVQWFPTGQKQDFLRLCLALNVDAHHTAVTPDEKTKPAKNAAKQKAVRERWRRMYSGLSHLLKMRGQFTEGHRSWAVFCFSMFGRRAWIYRNPQELWERCKRLGLMQCSPPLELDEIKRKFDSGQKPSRNGGFGFSYEQMKSVFAVTDSELAAIPDLRMKAKYQSTNKRKNAIEEIDLLVAECGGVPTATELIMMLGNRGLKVSRASLFRYLSQMSLKIPVRKNYLITTVLAEKLRLQPNQEPTAKRVQGFGVIEGGKTLKHSQVSA